ncbi:COQ9 family protein [Pseudooceanicola sp. CBS1P-1]|uniref:COQ9 family protein n=1 Tax=Pseudooceanicola albus TaxID=2692189 RepID=A0A6L7GA82_9RHOB|nr:MULTISPECIES: COQ9 family protein [Pseudooceanicola]MBT9386404.1 COQ9 family protein [Pseudooceanicola endophyticus]MXN20438.1 COQ9 family protein [Pseudooceanicola albus]
MNDEITSPGGAGPSARERMLDAALMHVPFDGWSETSLRAAAADSELSLEAARVLFPRGAVDMALAYHRQGDAQMVAQLQAEDLSGLRFSEKIARAIEIRLELADRELVRRGSTLFALPQHAADGAKAVWGTADAIWTALGDTSEDVNWYTKRMTLSGVYSATVLYWLGDDSLDGHATREFLERRIEGVMRFEKVKGRVAASPLGRMLEKPLGLFARVKAPKGASDLPGQMGRGA